MKESVIEKHLVKRVKELGGEVRKVQWIGRRGAPDRLVMVAAHCTCGKCKTENPQLCCNFVCHGYRFPLSIWVELKAPGVAPEPYQLREHERMRKMGLCVVVIDSIEAVEELLA